MRPPVGGRRVITSGEAPDPDMIVPAPPCGRDGVAPPTGSGSAENGRGRRVFFGHVGRAVGRHGPECGHAGETAEPGVLQ
ncbi:hypothetical protein SAMN02982918_0995 [Saccharomonospora viridis]|nr:hypothetical protein SAMN02982918_0995 [Saccharomonospora viridis]